jgi:hypothetical protein
LSSGSSTRLTPPNYIRRSRQIPFLNAEHFSRLKHAVATLQTSTLLHFPEHNTLSFAFRITPDFIPVWYWVKIAYRSTFHYLQVLYYVLSCCVVFCRVVFCVLSCRDVVCRVLSCRVVFCRVASRRVASCRVVSCCVLSCCFVVAVLCFLCCVLFCHVVFFCRVVLFCRVVSCYITSHHISHHISYHSIVYHIYHISHHIIYYIKQYLFSIY